MRAGEAGVGLFEKALGMQAEGELPNEQQQEGKSQKTPCIQARQKDERGEHHGIIPVVDAAASAAFVLHKPGLEGAEEENADHVADRVEKADEEQNTAVDQMRVIEHADQGVQRDPRQCHQSGGACRFDRGHGCLGGDKVDLKLLLAAHAFGV